jgi:rsbT co-antagonist protein RsbR
MIPTKEELERRIAELEDQVERLRHFEEISHEGLVLHEQGKIFDVNPALVAMFGYSEASEVVGKEVLEFIAPEAHETAAQYMRAGHTHPLELPAVRKDGTVFPMETSAHIYNAQGRMIRGVSIRDITERRQTETEHERMLNILESSADFISMATPEGKGLYINPAGLEMIGYTQEEFDAGMNIAQVQPDLSPEVFQTAVAEGMWSGEGTLIHKNGDQMIISQTITCLKDDAGNLEGFSTIIRDITAIRQTEAERESLQKEVIEAQQRAIAELSTPVIPVMDRIIVMPLVGSIDSMRARDITRSLLAGISQHRAKVVILDVTGVGLMDTGIVNHLNKTIQAARLKGAQTIVTGISDAVAEAIVDLGIDWSEITTLSDLQTGLIVALDSLGVRLTR